MKLKQKQNGFSIIEIVITLFIVAVMLALYQATLYGIPLAKNAKDQDVALKIAANKLESLRSAGYDLLPAIGSSADPDLNSQITVLPTSSANITVSAYNARTKQVSVTVNWKEPNATTHSVTLTTLITQIGGLQ